VTPLIALAALVAVPITTAAGEWLMARVGHTELIAAHQALGNTLLPWAIATFIVALMQWVWFRYIYREGERLRAVGRPLRVAITIALAAAVAVTAVGSVVTVVLIGESGARAVWTGTFTQSPR
jgi:hypothetical protein